MATKNEKKIETESVEVNEEVIQAQEPIGEESKKKTVKKSKAKSDPKETGQDNSEDEMPEDVLPDNDVRSSDEDFDNEEDLAMDIATALAEIMSKRNNTLASRSDRKKLYGGGIRVSRSRSAMSEDRALTREERIKEELKFLTAAQVNGRKFIKVHVEAIEEDQSYGYITTARLANKEIGEFSIHIPASELFSIEDRKYMQQKTSNNDPNEKALLFRNDLERFVGSDVNVVITSVDEYNRIAWASRLRANEILTDICFRKKRKNGQPLVKEGMIREGEILFAKRDRLWVCVDGIDMEIKSEEAGWTSMGPLNEEKKFKRGNRVNVKLLTVEPDIVREVNGKTLHLASGTGSIKQAEEDPQKSYLKDFKIGQICEGEVKNIGTDGMVYVNLCGGKVSAKCEPGIDLPRPGQIRLVKIRKIYDDTGHILGKIINEAIR